MLVVGAILARRQRTVCSVLRMMGLSDEVHYATYHQVLNRAMWDAVKDGVMKEALLAKFTQHSHLRELLLATGDAMLVEHTENDS